MDIKYKVLNKDFTSPFKKFQFKLGKKYHCDDFNTNKKLDCAEGFYATDIDGVVYSWNCNDKIICECEVWGKSVIIDQYKQRYENIKLIRKLPKKKIIKLARNKEKKIGYKLSEILYPYNPLKKRTKPTKKDIELLKQWVSVWNSVWASVWNSVWNSVGASVRTSVWNSVGTSVGASVRTSVGAYISSLFPNIKKWKYIDHKEGINPFQPGIDLWYHNLVPSYDGEIWRLHSDKKAEIVWEGKI